MKTAVPDIDIHIYMIFVTRRSRAPCVLFIHANGQKNNASRYKPFCEAKRLARSAENTSSQQNIFSSVVISQAYKTLDYRIAMHVASSYTNFHHVLFHLRCTESHPTIKDKVATSNGNDPLTPDLPVLNCCEITVVHLYRSYKRFKTYSSFRTRKRILCLLCVCLRIIFQVTFALSSNAASVPKPDIITVKQH